MSEEKICGCGCGKPARQAKSCCSFVLFVAEFTAAAIIAASVLFVFCFILEAILK